MLYIILLVVLAILVIADIVISNILINFSLSKAYYEKHKESLMDEDFYLSTPSEMEDLKNGGEKVIVTSYDNLKLEARYVSSEKQSHSYVIAMHGYHGNPYEMAHYGFHYLNNFDFNILIPAQRAHGESEGNYTTMGFKEKFDLLSWINYIDSIDKDANILLFGISMGAATVTQAMGLELPTSVKAVIADCGYTSCYDEFKWQSKQMFKLPPFPIISSANFFNKLRLGFKFQDANSITALKHSTLPILFIHGDADTFVPFKMFDELYKEAKGPKAKCVIEGAKHALAERTNPEKYWSAVDSFLKKNFPLSTK